MKNKYRFLTCHWENLVYLNFYIDPELIAKLLPQDIEPDLLKGKAVISIVCFEFSEAKLFGFKIPFHQYFPEINIRTYVKRKDDESVKGIYFLSEMVPKFMTYFTGKFIFGEPFSLRNLKISKTQKELQFSVQDSICEMNIKVEKNDISANQMLTEEQDFVINRGLAFCGKINKNAKVYLVEHPKWNLINLNNFECTVKKIKHLNTIIQNVLLHEKPESIFMTDGSGVEVFNDFFI